MSQTAYAGTKIDVPAKTGQAPEDTASLRAAFERAAQIDELLSQLFRQARIAERLTGWLKHFSIIDRDYGQDNRPPSVRLDGYEACFDVTPDIVRTDSDVSLKTALDTAILAAANDRAQSEGISVFGSERDQARLTLAAMHMGLTVLNPPEQEIIEKYRAEWNGFITTMTPDGDNNKTSSPFNKAAKDHAQTSPLQAALNAQNLTEQLYEDGRAWLIDQARALADSGKPALISVESLRNVLGVSRQRATALYNILEEHENFIERQPNRQRLIRLDRALTEPETPLVKATPQPQPSL